MSCQIESLEDRQETEYIIKNLKSDPKKKNYIMKSTQNLWVTSTENV